MTQVPSVKKMTLRILIIVVLSVAVLPRSAAHPKEIVVLLHGLGRSASSMKPLQKKIEAAGFIVKLIDYKSLDRRPGEILQDVAKQIEAIPVDSDRTIHFVGHSLGGLLIRAYLDSHSVRTLGRVVLIGVPNKGTPFVDYFHDAWWLKLAGPTAVALGTGARSFPRALRPPYYPVGVIAGVANLFDNEDFIPGEDDGVVPVESTKVEGMTDFVLVETSHSMMRRNETVALQTIAFLQKGRFITTKKK